MTLAKQCQNTGKARGKNLENHAETRRTCHYCQVDGRISQLQFSFWITQLEYVQQVIAD